MFNIAIAEDHPLMRAIFSLYCQSIGLNVLAQVGDGLELQEYLSTSDTLPDIVFMDINMPVINGQQATSHIHKNYPSIKVIALSVFCHEWHIINMFNRGARGYLPKDVQPEEVYHAVQAVMNGQLYIPTSIARRWNISPSCLNTEQSKKYKTKLLNTREYEFLSYCATGLGYKEIACKMGLQYKTIDNYRASVSLKLNIPTRAGMAVYATTHGLQARI